MRINKKRLKANLKNIGEIGKNENGGITRLAFSNEYYQAADKLQSLMEKANLEVKRDGIGSIFAKREGQNNSLPSIMIGSHLDTVKNGGLFDGALGVMAALECFNVLNEEGIVTKHPLELAAFNAEEGSEMGGTFGSRVMMGLQDPDDSSLENKIKKYDLTKENIRNSLRNPDEIKAFLELHVEQGAVLDNEQIPIGIVTGIAGITRYKIIVNGEANHSGTTPMNLRKDALTSAAKLITEIEEEANKISDPFVATIGKVDIYPGSVNVIPGQVELVLEMRDLSQNKIENAIERFKSLAKKIDDVDIQFEKMINKPPVKTNDDIMKCIENGCLKDDITYKYMASGAGHDAKEIARKVSTGMIFVPSKDGKSHCPEEWTDWDDIYQGVEVMLNTILNIDKSI